MCGNLALKILNTHRRRRRRKLLIMSTTRFSIFIITNNEWAAAAFKIGFFFTMQTELMIFFLHPLKLKFYFFDLAINTSTYKKK